MNEQDEDYGTEPLLPEWLTRRRLYRGWWVVILGFFLLAVSARAQVETGFALLMDLDRPRVVAGQDGFPTNTEYYLLIVVILVLAPVVGLVVDRFGPIVVILPVMVGSAIIIAAAGITDELWVQHFAWLVIVGILAGTVLIGFTKVLTSWFSRNQGKALAMLLAGVMLAPLMPAFPFQFHRVFYWFLPYDFTVGVWPDVREANTLAPIDVSILLALGIIPAYLFLKRRPPNSLSTHREGHFFTAAESDDESTNTGSAPEPTVPLRSILLSRTYLLLLAASTLQASAILILPNLPVVFVFQDLLGYSQEFFPLRVSEYWSPLGSVSADVLVLGAIVLLVSGVLADRFGGRRVIFWTIVMQLLCGAILAFEIEGWSALVFPVAIGAGVGTLCVPIVVLLREYWGSQHFGVLLGILASATLGGYRLARELYFPALYEQGYWLPYDGFPYVVMAMLTLALVLILLMKRPKARVGEAAEMQVVV